jgi:Rrf2 family protein
MLELARTGQRMKSAALAERVGTTPGFLSQALTPAVAQGWVRSDPGPTGGYSLVEDLDRISVLSVIEAVEGPTDAGRCVLEDRACSGGGPCALHQPWSRARTLLTQELADSTLASLAGGGS